MNVDVNVDFSPGKLKAFSRNEANMTITLKNNTNEIFWGECEVNVTSPLSLAHDAEMNNGRTRVGIVKPMGTATKQVKIYTRPNNYPDDYTFSVVAYIYDGDGAISERVEKKASIMCAVEEGSKQAGQPSH